MKNYYFLLLAVILFSISSRAQTLTAISPSQGVAGTTVTAILTGQNTFFMSSSPQGLHYFQLNKGYCRILYGTNIIPLNDDSVQVDIPIPAGYVNDVYNISVWTGAGQSLGLPASFTITGGVNQSIQGFSPSTTTEDASFTAQITGQNLQTLAGLPGFHLTLKRNNRVYPASNVTVISPGQLDADFYIPAFADTGYYECIIQAQGNCYNLPNAIHVTGAFPKQLVSITPSSANAGTTLTALVTGQNTFFLSSSPPGSQNIQSIKLENAYCNIYNGTSINIIDNENLNVDFNFPADASNGPYDLTVRYVSGIQYVLPNSFTINTGVDRSVISFTSAPAAAGTTITATIDGTGLADIIAHAPVSIKLISNAGFIITSTVYSMSGQQLLADFTIPLYADNGSYRFELTSGTGCYKLNSVVQVSGGTPPAILSIAPSQGLRGQTLTALMTGRYTFFMSGTQTGGISSVTFNHATTAGQSFSVMPPNIAFIDSEHVNLNITIPAGVKAGYYNVVVNRVGNTTLTLNPGFEVRGTVVSGRVFFDVDSNGIYNTGDFYLANQEISARPDNILTFTNTQGNYSVGVEPGLDTIAVIPDSGWIHTSADSYIFTVGANDTSGFDFGVRPLVDEYDVLCEHTAGFPRCNSNAQYHITFKNNSTNVVDATLWWLPDTALQVISSNPPPTSTNGDTLFWTVTNLLVQANFNVVSVIKYPGAGIVVRSFGCAEATHNGTWVASSCDSVRQNVVCSFDPNDKSVEPEGIYAQHYTLGQDYLTYLIRFQNTGTDTAFNISVFDTIDASLDLGTFELITSSHPVNVYISGRIVEFRHSNILLPDSNVDEPMSHGFVKFRIKPVHGFIEGSIVNNNASIVFDMNAGVITNTVMNTIVSQLPLAVRELESGQKQLILFPNPTDGKFRIELPSNERMEGTVLVIDQTGRVLRRISVEGENGEINLGNYPGGIYSIVLINKNGVARNRIIVY